MPTKHQNEKRKSFFKFCCRYDNLRIRYYSMSKGERGYSYLVSVLGTSSVKFKLIFQSNMKYRVITLAESKVRVPRKLSNVRFDKPEEALVETTKVLQELGYRVYKSNSLDFIMKDE